MDGHWSEHSLLMVVSFVCFLFLVFGCFFFRAILMNVVTWNRLMQPTGKNCSIHQVKFSEFQIRIFWQMANARYQVILFLENLGSSTHTGKFLVFVLGEWKCT